MIHSARFISSAVHVVAFSAGCALFSPAFSLESIIEVGSGGEAPRKIFTNERVQQILLQRNSLQHFCDIALPCVVAPSSRLDNH